MKSLYRCAYAAIVALAMLGSAAQAQDIKVGVIWPIKTIAGEEARRSAELAVNRINDAGGLLGGRKIKLIVYDDNFDPAQGVSAARRLMSQDGVKLLVGGMASAVSLAILQVAQQNDALYINTGSVHPDITKYAKAFRMNTSIEQIVGALKTFVDQVGPASKIATIVENGDYGRRVTMQIKDAFGVKVVDTELFEIASQSDFSTIATKVGAVSPDVIFTSFSSSEQGAALLRALHDSGTHAKFFTVPGSLTPQLLKITGEAANGVYSADTWVSVLDNPENKTFVDMVESRYHEPPGKLDFLGYEDIVVLAAAIEKAGTADNTTAIADALKANEWKTPRGTVYFRSGQALAKGSDLVQVEAKDGALQVRH